MRYVKIGVLTLVIVIAVVFFFPRRLSSIVKLDKDHETSLYFGLTQETIPFDEAQIEELKEITENVYVVRKPIRKEYTNSSEFVCFLNVTDPEVPMVFILDEHTISFDGIQYRMIGDALANYIREYKIQY